MKPEVAKSFLKSSWSKIHDSLNSSRIDKSTGKRMDDAYVIKIANMLLEGHSFRTRLQTEKIALEEYGISDKKTVKELSELATIVAARKIANSFETEEAYEKLIQLYENQPMSTHQTGTSINLGQFSTPIPMTFIMGKYCRVGEDSSKIFLEPTGGNGMLCVVGSPKSYVVNEIDLERLYILKKQGFKEVLHQDALHKFPFHDKYFDGCLSNPPFGTTPNFLIMHGMKISGLEQHIIVKSLEYVKDGCRSAFIIGCHTEYDEAGRLSGIKNKGFLSYLAKYYHLDDVINMEGKLYGRQGTTYPTRMILVSGRKSEVGGFYPLLNKDLDKFSPFSSGVINSFEELWIRTKNLFINK